MCWTEGKQPLPWWAATLHREGTCFLLWFKGKGINMQPGLNAPWWDHSPPRCCCSADAARLEAAGVSGAGSVRPVGFPPLGVQVRGVFFRQEGDRPR